MKFYLPPEESWKDWFYIALGVIACVVVYASTGPLPQ